MAQDRPNILLLMTDQQRYDSLGCYGFAAAHTPHLDRLATEGVIFDRCYINNPICTPSRASMLTGKCLPGHGVYRLHDILPASEALIGKRLQEVGYSTALFGKLHVSGRVYEAQQRHPNDGFDVYEWCMDPRLHWDSPFNAYTRWLAEQDPAASERMRQGRRKSSHVPREYHMTHWAAERTIDFIQRWDGGRPFFCFMSVFDPHSPYDDYPLELEGLIDRARIPDPVLAPGEMERAPRGLRRQWQRLANGAYGKLSPEGIRQARLGYHVSIALADLEMGRVLEALQAKGIADNTLVLFTSDHGDMMGDHHLFTKGAFFYDPCVRVPLIARWPARLPAWRRVPALVQPHDLAATILSAAGYPPGQIARVMPESRDLIPVAAGDQASIRDHVICCFRNSVYGDGDIYFDPPLHATMIRDERYKLSVYHDLEGVGRGCEGLLHDMQQDPNELHDLWHDPGHQAVKMRLLQRLLDWVTGQEVKWGSRGGEALVRPGHE